MQTNLHGYRPEVDTRAAQNLDLVAAKVISICQGQHETAGHNPHWCVCPSCAARTFGCLRSNNFPFFSSVRVCVLVYSWTLGAHSAPNDVSPECAGAAIPCDGIGRIGIRARYVIITTIIQRSSHCFTSCEFLCVFVCSCVYWQRTSHARYMYRHARFGGVGGRLK